MNKIFLGLTIINFIWLLLMIRVGATFGALVSSILIVFNIGCVDND